MLHRRIVIPEIIGQMLVAPADFARFYIQGNGRAGPQIRPWAHLRNPRRRITGAKVE